MTLSDLLCYLRAKRGGVFYSDVAQALEIPTVRLVRAERTLANSDLTAAELGQLAEYFEVPLEELQGAQRQARADLTAYLAHNEKNRTTARLRLLGDVDVAGPVVWRDRHAVALRQLDDKVLVVYRSSIESWGNG